MNLDVPGTRLVVSGCPQLELLRQKHPEVVFTGPKFGKHLTTQYTSGDVFVFPSLTDTFGLVMLEAMASGMLVAAYPVIGLVEVLGDTKAAFMDKNLSKAVEPPLQVTAKKARKYAEKYSWNACTDQFLQNLVRAS